jgi:hypothetical protein
LLHVLPRNQIGVYLFNGVERNIGAEFRAIKTTLSSIISIHQLGYGTKILAVGVRKEVCPKTKKEIQFHGADVIEVLELSSEDTEIKLDHRDVKDGWWDILSSVNSEWLVVVSNHLEDVLIHKINIATF